MPPNLNSDGFCSAVPVAVPPSSAELPPCPHPAGIAHFFIPYGFYCSALSVELERFLMQPLEFPRLAGLVSSVSADNPGGLPKAQTGPDRRGEGTIPGTSRGKADVHSLRGFQQAQGRAAALFLKDKLGQGIYCCQLQFRSLAGAWTLIMDRIPSFS